jgi:hypothetical protein
MAEVISPTLLLATNARHGKCQANAKRRHLLR